MYKGCGLRRNDLLDTHSAGLEYAAQLPYMLRMMTLLIKTWVHMDG